MIRTADLYSIASSGLRASNQLLQTAGNNIANVNTEGYVRERTSFTSELSGGVSRATTERVISVFAQNQLRRDTTTVGEHKTYREHSSVLDNIFASEANSISSALNRFFGSIQTAADEPTNMAVRELVLGEANSLVGQISTMSEFLDDKEAELNFEMESMVNRANSLVETIANLNDQVRVIQSNNQFEEPGAIKNERDQAILELAELMSIETRPGTDGTTLVNLSSGESLVLENGTFNLFQLSGDPDLNYKSLRLDSSDSPTTLRLAETGMGGEMGGLFRYRDEILETAQRELGQIAMTMAASMNEQNRLGMDFDGQLGGDIFRLPTFSGLNYAGNSSLALETNARLTNDGARDLTAADYQVTITALGAGTVDVRVDLLNPDGTPVTDTSGAAISETFNGIPTAAGTFTALNGTDISGLELEFPSAGPYAVGDAFLIQPTKGTASSLEVQMTRPEDLALASPVRVDSSINNLGDAVLVSTNVTNTTVDTAAPFDPGSSAFDGAGGILNGVGAGNAPARIVFTSATDFEVQDSAGAAIVTVAGATEFSNIMAKAAAAAGWPFGAFTDYPGYDFSLQGVPQAGDTFDISYNTNGFNDNRNALELAGVQSDDIVLSSNNTTTSRITFQEKYANIVSEIGEKSAVAQIALDASEAMKDQSTNWMESISGVSLDEEAANLVRFQQTYSAAARVLSTAQSLFDTILSILR